MRRQRLILVAAIVVAAVVLIFFQNKGKDGGHPPIASANRTVTVERGDVVSRLAETGSLEPVGVVEIKSEQSGEVKHLFVGEGQAVEAGQPLAIIQQEQSQARQAAQFRADLEKERLNMEEAEREQHRQQSLFKSGFASQKEVEDADKLSNVAKIRYQLAKRQLLLVLGGNRTILEEYLSRDLSSDQLDEFVIKSPSAGIVIEVGVQEGEMITSGTSTVGGGTALLKIADLSRMVVKSKINEVNIIEVKLGQDVEIQLDAIPAQVYHGVVVGIAPIGERINNVVTYQVTVEIQDPDSQLKPSMTANVDIVTGTYKDVLYLPIEAVDREKGEDVVHMEKEGGIETRPLNLLIKTESVAVIAEGLKEKDRVVLPGSMTGEGS